MPRITPAQMAGNHRRSTDWCSGCGLHHYVTGEHRADCTTRPPACSHCRYYPNVNEGRHRADCPNHRTTSPTDAGRRGTEGTAGTTTPRSNP